MFYVRVFFGIFYVFFSNLYFYNTVLSELSCVNKDIIIIIYVLQGVSLVVTHGDWKFWWVIGRHFNGCPPGEEIKLTTLWMLDNL